MKKPFVTLVVAPVTLLAISGIALSAAEAQAQGSQEAIVKEFTATRLPETSVTRMNVRGRPYLLSRTLGEVPLAYVDLAAPSGSSRSQLIVRNVRGNRSGEISWLLWLPYPEQASKPVLSADGSFTQQARIGERVVTYGAAFDGSTLTVTATGGRAPAAVRVPSAKGFAATSIGATDDGILVELTSSK